MFRSEGGRLLSSRSRLRIEKEICVSPFTYALIFTCLLFYYYLLLLHFIVNKEL